MTPELSSSDAARKRPHLVSVIIPVYNGAKTLEGQLEALARQRYPERWEVVVADNGSDDGTVGLVSEWAVRLAGLRLVDASHRRGSAVARNAGVAAAGGDFLAFCEADDEVTETWLASLVRAGQSSDMVGGYLDPIPLNDPRSRTMRPPFPPRDRLPVHLNFLPYAIGANCGVWRHVLEAVGGWNESYEWGGGDVELSWRVQLASYTLHFAPQAIVRYRFRSTLRATSRQFLGYGQTHARLYREFRRHGVPRAGLRETVGPWVWLFLHLGDLASRSRRDLWVCKLSYNSGRLRGRIRDRVKGSRA